VKNQLWPQCDELLTNYGPIGGLWFDGEWADGWSDAQGRELYAHLRSLQPNLIVNDRVGKGRLDNNGNMKPGCFEADYRTPEQVIPPEGLPGVDWETCLTMGEWWGYCRNDRKWKPAGELIRTLVDVVSKGGNLLMNVGPTAEGQFPPQSVERLEAIGRWMQINGESIHGTSASVLPALSWGRCTVKPGKLFLHVFDWPKGSELVVPGLKSQVSEAYLLENAQEGNLPWSVKDGLVTIRVPKTPPDAADSVIVLETAQALP
jgi:alpha-L-fucosidase